MEQIPLGQSCSAYSFQYPDLVGASFTNLEAISMSNASASIPPGATSGAEISNLSFCNVTLTYTHPGYGDTIHTSVWLPTTDWNGRVQATGGGGFITGLWEPIMFPAVAEGYAVVSTDGGHVVEPYDVSSWAQSSPGNVNWNLLQDFASITLNDAAVIGKSITTQFYNRAPQYSYFKGCSTGGRQGLMLAQRYPDAYDGILATAPAINWAYLVPSTMWSHIVMNELGSPPPACELNAITAAAIAACDDQDGVTDGILSAPEKCDFDPHTLVGKEIACPNAASGKTTVSEHAATIALAAWTGPIDPADETNTPLFPGVNPGSRLTGLVSGSDTVCTSAASTTNCTSSPFPVGPSWYQYFLSPYSTNAEWRRDPASTFSSPHTQLDTAAFIRLMRISASVYDSILSTNDPDLSAYKARNGKMITWHGLEDPVIPSDSTLSYYQKVEDLDKDVRHYYRYFEAPGVEHCWGGSGPNPGSAFDALVDWVEKGIAPEQLKARSERSFGVSDDKEAKTEVWERVLCPWPQRAAYDGKGDVKKIDSWSCK